MKGRTPWVRIDTDKQLEQKKLYLETKESYAGLSPFEEEQLLQIIAEKQRRQEEEE